MFYGLQTVRQLLPPQVFREAKVDSVTWAIPAVRIVDRPRFAWRGAHLDVGRHFMPKEFVKKYIDLIALQKMNTFHWHLTEDQGWRIEIRKYPRLTQVGAWRTQTVVGRQNSQTDSTTWQFDGQRHGGFYTQDDVREIVAYARDRFVNVVPEIEMPGHALAAIAAYPELGVTGQPADVGTRWGVYANILNADSSTVSFMQDVLTEVMELFPSRFIHVGGDEADKALWKTSPRIQERIKELGVKDEHELQSWFIRADGCIPHRAQASPRRVGRDSRGRARARCDGHVVARNPGRDRRRARRARRRSWRRPVTRTSTTINRRTRPASRWRLADSFRSRRSIRSSRCRPSSSRSIARTFSAGQGQIWTEYLRGTEAGGIHGVPAPNGARRGAVDEAGAEGLSGLSGSTRRALAETIGCSTSRTGRWDRDPGNGRRGTGDSG